MGQTVRLSNNKKKQIKALTEQAAQAFAGRHFDLFERSCRKIESLQPGNPDVANMRAIVYSQSGQMEQAERLFLEAIEAAPKRGDFHGNLGNLYLFQERYADALPHYKEAMRLDPRALSARLGYGKALLEAGHHEDAYTVLEQAKKRHPRDSDVLMGLFCACYKSNRLDEGRKCLNALLELQPGHAEAHFQLGLLDIQAGRLAEGEAEIRTSLEARPDHVESYAVLAEARRHDSDEDPDIAVTTSLYERSAPDSGDRVKLGFAMGKIMDDLGHYDRAFGYFSEANAIRHRQSSYDNDRELGLLQAVMESYTPEALAETSGIDDETPIFIVGMPRCGSTLVEQILACHPEVGSKGEWNLFENSLFRRSSEEDPLTLDRLVSFTPEQWQSFGQNYLDNLRVDDPDALRITDKSLRNIRLIGAIHCALPKARIVHVRRHPLDTCLSIYKSDLRDRLFDYGTSLGELGYYYRTYLKLMQHWRDVLPEGVMYELDYEQLVADQEGETRKLLEACGLEWDARCLRFEQADTMVRTASIAQVRRSMYSDSLAAWKRYEKHLQPLIRILGTEQVL